MGRVNNHIHTIYSFSPYSPAQVAVLGKEAGLSSVGIVDHDTLGGVFEFLDEAKKVGIDACFGLECRVSFAGTKFAEKKLNNPDQAGIAYMTFQDIPLENVKIIDDFFAPLRKLRSERNQKICDKLNAEIKKFGIQIDYETDVLPLSVYEKGGTVTERHILFALSKALLKEKGNGLLDFLEKDMGLKLNDKLKGWISDSQNPYIEYDLLNVLKGVFNNKIYVNATDECPSIDQVSDLAKKSGATLAYAYLGDVKGSVTGDKPDAPFEDSFLEELMIFLKEKGFGAIAYMPPRNTEEQIKNLLALCEKYGFSTVTGDDVNSPRQEI